MTVNRFEIAAPIWNGGKRFVGLNVDRLNCDMVEIDIQYRNKTGERVYPQLLNMRTAKVKSYPIQVVGGGVKLHIIPVADLAERSIKSQVIARPAKVCGACGGQEFWVRSASELGGKEEELCCRCHPRPKVLLKEESNE